MFIETEDTPNPQSMKFRPGRTLLGADSRGRDFPNSETAAASPLAAALFAIDGVTGVFIGSDFITVTKADDADWRHVKPMTLGVIADHLTADLPIFAPGEPSVQATETDLSDYEGEDREVVQAIIEVLNERVRPAVATDGGDISFRYFEPRTGVVFLKMHGACSGCPSSTMTLKAGIENMLKHYVPEVVKVEAVA
jgi:Fe-S cluster biogenesis protein NfuA